MASAAEIIRSMLVDLGLGTDPSSQGLWPIFVSNEPNRPDNCITIYDTASSDDGRSMVDGELFSHEGLQVRVRSVDYPTGYTKANSIRTALAKSINFRTTYIDSQGYLVYCCSKIGNVLPIGTEQTSKRQLFTLNCLVSMDN